MNRLNVEKKIEGLLKSYKNKTSSIVHIKRLPEYPRGEAGRLVQIRRTELHTIEEKLNTVYELIPRLYNSLKSVLPFASALSDADNEKLEAAQKVLDDTQKIDWDDHEEEDFWK